MTGNLHLGGTILPGTDLNLMEADFQINGPFTVTNQGTISIEKS